MIQKILILAMLSLFLVQCQKKQDTNSAPETQTYEIGNPISLVAHTYPNNKSIWSSDNVQAFDGFYLSQVTIFKSRGKNKSFRELKSEQAPKDAEDVTDPFVNNFMPFKMFPLVDIEKNENDFLRDRELYIYRNTDLQDGIVFENKDGYLHAVYYKSGSAFVDLESRIQHYSLASDGNSFSILFYGRPNNDARLVAYFFTKKYNTDFLKKIDAVGENNFSYMQGPNIIDRWTEKTVHIDICSQELLDQREDIQRSLDSWASHIHHTKFILGYNTHPAPFSDLNQHCIYLAHDYVFSAGKKIEESAVTISFETDHIVDSDIILLEDELHKTQLSFTKNGADQIPTAITHRYFYYNNDKLNDARIFLRSVYVHEFGHFLGLGHQFDLKTPSVMSYSKDDDVLTDYDKKAIANLYR